eukprot:CAMPEP_0194312970 /NCGR_PEP_ID=MMETSP0171-20130528/9861_1 /TAXON_ID=218684 /ORGANISM="Corethron pennatum, Strain L29A3" /LENGTH=1345 /DNA_ID=CAMNT_0039067707 /DNA_START=51 /DNA_END=4088 /DNA_ORIENTATION=+
MSTADPHSKSVPDDGKFHFSIDRGGTFTDIHAILPSGSVVVSKLLSVDPANYDDAPTEGIRRVLDAHHVSAATGTYARRRRDEVASGATPPLPTNMVGSVRMGTTVATNALLERNGCRAALLTNVGFGDLLEIGNQSRPNIFDLSCAGGGGVLYERVVEVEERVMLGTFTDGSTKTVLETRTSAFTGEAIHVLRRPDLPAIKTTLAPLLAAGIKSLAIVLMHAHAFPDHENAIADLATSMGFTHVSSSSAVMPMVRMVGRGHTACASAYLTPVITDYLGGFLGGFDDGMRRRGKDGVRLDFMMSDGGLVPHDGFGGHRAVLSGPAGGVVGYARTSYGEDRQPVIGFDMGGTSTDVSRYAGSLEHVLETTTAGVTIQSPQLDISTVAAGGGSVLGFSPGGMYRVGPDSARAHPGPVCYRKGGVLAVTDANVVLGRVIPECFPKIFGKNEDEALDVEGSREAFRKLIEEEKTRYIGSGDNPYEGVTIEEVAYGFLKVANEAMCRPIRNLTQMRGFDITTHKLSCFGGAGPQHACAMAKSLGMTKVLVHKYAGILSAVGLSMADAGAEAQEPAVEAYSLVPGSKNETLGTEASRAARFDKLVEKAKAELMQQGYKDDQIVVERFLNMRYEGTDNAMMVSERGGPDGVAEDFGTTFRESYIREFGFALDRRDILSDDFRVRAVVPGPTLSQAPAPARLGKPVSSKMARAYFEGGWKEVEVYKVQDLEPGHEIKGPAIIVQPIATVVLEIGTSAVVTAEENLEITVMQSEKEEEPEMTESGALPVVKEDPIQLSIFGHRFMGIAEQMGRTLARTSTSVNIKERLDFSCALFTPEGGLVANAPHIPVHLGSMQEAVRFQVKYWNSEGREGVCEGDVFLSNHPQLAGGSHLPDLTVITPVFNNGKIIFFVASRGHHSDIGGIAPGSMPPNSKFLVDEGAAIVSFKLVRNGVFQEERVTEILMEPGKIPGNSGTRNLRDNISDLRAQVAANNAGIRLLNQLVDEYSLHVVHSYMNFIQQNAELSVRKMLKDFAIKNGSRHQAVDFMDDGSRIELTVDIDEKTGNATFDFTGTGAQVLANHNTPPAVAYSAVIYCLRCLVGADIPLNQGCLAPIKFIIPKYTLLNPSVTAAVVGGNVLTSQRVVDVVLRTFNACAASQGCMNNFTFGDEEFGYYETIAGGSGAGPKWVGRSGVHTHMTNTRITDPEILERRYPVLLNHFSLRKGSGGDGANRGGDGVIREVEPLRKLTMSILSERRVLQPYGLMGGESGKCGINLLIRRGEVSADGTEGEMVVNMGGRCTTDVVPGERIRIETPGGGGYGLPGSKSITGSKQKTGFIPRAQGRLGQFASAQETA